MSGPKTKRDKRLEALERMEHTRNAEDALRGHVLYFTRDKKGERRTGEQRRAEMAVIEDRIGANY
jgi:hypothetical protein